MKLNRKSTQWLLSLARKSIEYFMETKNFLPIENVAATKEIAEEIDKPSGAIVILEILRSGRKSTQIRGQSGIFEAVESLGKLVSQLAVNAAFFDASTPRLKPYELNDLRIHLFVPSALKLVATEVLMFEKLEKELSIGVMVLARGRLAYDLPILRDLQESPAHRLRRLRLQLGMSRKNSESDVEYYAFTGQHAAEAVDKAR